MTAHALPYRREIDGLRAIAILPVLFFHAGLEVFAGGFVGVDVFFVISGYLITSILMRQTATGRFSIYDFYERRARRILPALYLVLFLCVPVAWLAFMPRDLKNFANSLLATLTFTSNHLFSQQSGYFDTAAELKPLLHTWSLSVEEQFYLLFPFMLILLRRRGRVTLWTVIVGAAVLSFACAETKIFAKPAANFYLMPTRGWELLVGAALAIYGARPKGNELAAVIGLGAILAACFLFHKYTPFPGVYGLAPVLGTALLIQFATRETYVGRLLSLKPVVGAGLVSYSLYLWHQPILAFGRYLYGELGAGAAFTLCAVSFGPAYLSWRFVEGPFRDRKVVSAKALWWSLGVASVVLALLALFAAKTIDAKWRIAENPLADGDVAQEEYYRMMQARFPECEPAEVRAQAPRYNEVLRCRQSRPGQADVAIVGDSHGEHYFVGLADARPEINFVYFTDNPEVTGELVEFGIPHPENGAYKRVFEFLARPGSPRTVLVTTRYVERMADPGLRARRMARFKAGVLRLLELGKKVTVVGDVPSFDQDATLCKFKAPLRRDYACEIPRSRFDGQTALFRELRDLIGPHENLEYVELGDPFCGDETCSMILNGKIMFRDTNHLNIPGSKYVGGILAAKINFDER